MNDTVSEWQAAGKPDTERPGGGDIIAKEDDSAPVRRYEDSLAVSGMSGDIEELPLYAGQSAGLTDEVQPVDKLVTTLAEETTEALQVNNR